MVGALHVELWAGDILPPPGPYHVCVAVQGNKRAEVEEATRSFFAIVADGKRCYVRVPAGPATHHHDYLHKIDVYEAWCRFTLYLEAGEAVMPEPDTEERYISFLMLKGAK